MRRCAASPGGAGGARRRARRWLGLPGALLLVAAPACRPADAPPAAVEEPAASSVLARAAGTQWTALTLEVVALSRPAPDMLEVTLAIVNAPGAAAFEPRDAFAADPSETSTLSGVYLTDAGGQRKHFVLRDAEGRPLCSTRFGPIEPGGRVEGFARFVAPGHDVPAVTVHVPGFAPAGPVPLASARPM